MGYFMLYLEKIRIRIIYPWSSIFKIQMYNQIYDTNPTHVKSRNLQMRENMPYNVFIVYACPILNSRMLQYLSKIFDGLNAKAQFYLLLFFY